MVSRKLWCMIRFFFYAGMVAPIVAETLMGWQGQLMVVVIIIMAVIPTASAEVIAVTSILVYDIYQIYLKVISARLL